MRTDTHPDRNQYSILLCHMTHMALDMSNPANDGFKFLAKDMNAPVYICDEDTDGRRGNA